MLLVSSAYEKSIEPKSIAVIVVGYVLRIQFGSSYVLKVWTVSIIIEGDLQ